MGTQTLRHTYHDSDSDDVSAVVELPPGFFVCTEGTTRIATKAQPKSSQVFPQTGHLALLGPNASPILARISVRTFGRLGHRGVAWARLAPRELDGKLVAEFKRRSRVTSGLLSCQRYAFQSNFKRFCIDRAANTRHFAAPTILLLM